MPAACEKIFFMAVVVELYQPFFADFLDFAENPASRVTAFCSYNSGMPWNITGLESSCGVVYISIVEERNSIKMWESGGHEVQHSNTHKKCKSEGFNVTIWEDMFHTRTDTHEGNWCLHGSRLPRTAFASLLLFQTCALQGQAQLERVYSSVRIARVGFPSFERAR